jgi:hypothetical protein
MKSNMRTSKKILKRVGKKTSFKKEEQNNDDDKATLTQCVIEFGTMILLKHCVWHLILFFFGFLNQIPKK